MKVLFKIIDTSITYYIQLCIFKMSIDKGKRLAVMYLYI